MTALLLALISSVAAALRLHAITAKIFWFDECFSAEIAKLRWPQFFLALFNHESNMAFYYFLLRFWIRIGGSIGFMRGFSVLVSVATVPLLYVLGKKLFDRQTGLVATWLLSINTYHIYYAQEARSYALVVFLTVLATWIFVRNIREPNSEMWGAYTAACVLLVYSHFFGGLILLAHGAFLWFLKREEATWQPFRKSVIRFTYFLIPILIAFCRTGPGLVMWIPRPGLEAVWNMLVVFSGNGGTWLLALYAIAVLSSVFGAWSEWRANKGTFDHWAYTFVFVWLAFPILAILVVSIALPLFVPRYLIPCLPALVLIAAAGITRLRPVWLASILLVAISLASSTGIAAHYRTDFEKTRDDWPAASAFVFDHAQAQDGIFFFLHSGRVPFEFYRSQRKFPPLWPESLQAQRDSDLTGRDFRFQRIDKELAMAKPAGDRVWLVFIYEADTPDHPNYSRDKACAFFGQGRSLMESRDFGGIKIMLYGRVPATRDDVRKPGG